MADQKSSKPLWGAAAGGRTLQAVNTKLPIGAHLTSWLEQLLPTSLCEAQKPVPHLDFWAGLFIFIVQATKVSPKADNGFSNPNLEEEHTI